MTSGGSPGAYFEANHTFSTGDRIVTGGIKDDFEYDPATEGPLDNFTFSASLLHPPRGSSAWQVVVEQNGTRYYSYPYNTFETTGAWIRVKATNLNARDFDVDPLANVGGVAPSQSPDFGSTGGRIKFGFAFGNTVANGNETLNHTLGMDNFLVTTTSTPTVSLSASVPEGAEGADFPQFVIEFDAIQKKSTTVNYKVSGTSKNGKDYKKLKGRANIKAGTSSATITVQIKDDSTKEDIETVKLKLKKSSSYAIDKAAKTASVQILDND